MPTNLFYFAHYTRLTLSGTFKFVFCFHTTHPLVQVLLVVTIYRAHERKAPGLCVAPGEGGDGVGWGRFVTLDVAPF